MILKNLQTSVVLLLVLTPITGLVYPLLVTGIAQLLFPHQANGCALHPGERRAPATETLVDLRPWRSDCAIRRHRDD